MPRGDIPVPIEVKLGACLCAGTPHPDGDFVMLAPKLSAEAGTAASAAYALNNDDPTELETAVVMGLMRHGAIASWNFLDEKGEDVPVTPANVDRYLPWTEGGREVASKITSLVVDGQFSPFTSGSSTKKQKRSSRSSPRGPSTSPVPISSSRTPPSSESPSEPDSDGEPSAASR